MQQPSADDAGAIAATGIASFVLAAAVPPAVPREAHLDSSEPFAAHATHTMPAPVAALISSSSSSSSSSGSATDRGGGASVIATTALRRPRGALLCMLAMEHCAVH